MKSSLQELLSGKEPNVAGYGSEFYFSDSEDPPGVYFKCVRGWFRNQDFEILVVDVNVDTITYFLCQTCSDGKLRVDKYSKSSDKVDDLISFIVEYGL